MFKKSITISLGLFILFFCSSLLLQSCKCEQKVCNFTFNVSDINAADTLNKDQSDGKDTSLNGMYFSFIAFYESDNPACAWNTLGFNSAYAFTQYCQSLNQVLEESYTLTLDRDILINGTTIAAGTDLIQHTALKNAWEKELSQDGIRGPSFFGRIKLDDAAYNQIQFDTGFYNVTFSFSTDDGQNLSQQLDVVYKL